MYIGSRFRNAEPGNSGRRDEGAGGERLKLLDIWQYRDRNPFDLSGGQMQRVAIASVLVMRPDVMILDEPTSRLDRRSGEIIPGG